MMENFVKTLRDELRADMNNYTDTLAGGACRGFDEYQKLCGVIQGLAIAERHLLDLAQKAKKDDE